MDNDLSQADLSEIDANFQNISQKLMAARHAKVGLSSFPGDLPKTFADAYEVQRMSRDVWPDKIAGWKVGGVPADFVEHFGETRLTGPIFSASVVEALQGEVAQMPVFDAGFSAIEPEFIIELGNKRAEDRMYIGAEIAGSSIPAINEVGPIAVICDFGNNNGMLLGQEIENWQSIAPETLVVETHIDGEKIATRVLDDFRADPVAAVEFLIAHARKYSVELPKGTFVSTGAITGVHEAVIGAQSHLDFGKFGSLDLTLTKSGPAK